MILLPVFSLYQLYVDSCSNLSTIQLRRVRLIFHFLILTNLPPYQWRANTGYRPPQNMYYFQGQPVWLQAPVPCVQYHQHIHFNYPRHLTLVPPPPPPQKPKAVEEKAKDVEEKNDAEDKAPSNHSAPKTLASKKTATDKPPSGKGSCKSKKTSTKEQQDEEPKPSEKGAPSTKTASSHIVAKRNPATPPSLKNGQNYMFPLEHTRLHILNRAARIWEKKHEKSEL